MSFFLTYIQTPSENPKKPNIKIAAVYESKIDSAEYYLPADLSKNYMLALKLSASTVGITLAARDFTHVAVYTIKLLYTEEDAEKSILTFIRRLIQNKNLIFFAFQKYKSQTSLINKILNIKELKNLDKSLKFRPYPHQWKSTVCDKKVKGISGRFNIKEEIAKDIVKMYPALEEYLKEMKRTIGHDFDGFDSFGILTHIRLKHFNKDWQRMNYDSQTQTGLFFVFMKYVEDDVDVIHNEFIEWFSLWFGGLDESGKPKNLVEIREWTTEKSIYTNYVMAANSGKLICMESANNKLNLSYLIQTGEKFDSNKRLWVAVCKASRFLVQERHFPAFSEKGFLCRKFYRANLKAD